MSDTNGYFLDGEIYLGRKGSTPAEKNQAQRVVTQLVQPHYNSGRNVTCDNFFTSLSLAEVLYENGLTLLGTLRKNRKEIPKEFLSLRRPLHSTIFAYKGRTQLLSYMAKKSKCVLVLSTLHRSNEVRDDEDHKPQTILDYNMLKCPVDVLDQMANTYTTRRKVRRWPVTVFENVLDLAAINAFVTWIKCHPDWHSGQRTSRRRLFLKEMAIELLLPNMSMRVVESPRGAMQPKVKKARLVCSSKAVCSHPDPTEAESLSARKRGRCHLCSANRRVFSFCHVCKRHVCNHHSKVVCENCFPSP